MGGAAAVRRLDGGGGARAWVPARDDVSRGGGGDLRVDRRGARSRPQLGRHLPRGGARLCGRGRGDGVARVIDAAEYRDRFPILETCTYLINHSLAAMPAAAEDNLREYARVWLECYQSAGVVDVDLTELAVDFAVGGSVKWLCGGPGAGWLYVRPDVAERLEPTLVGWQAHARPFAFERELEYAAGARRFLTGTPNVPALYAATAGYDVIEEVGVPRIRERSLALTQLLFDLYDEAGLEVVSPREPERRGGTVTVSTPDHAACHKELGERGIVCDFRPDPLGGVRLGPHFFNT